MLPISIASAQPVSYAGSLSKNDYLAGWIRLYDGLSTAGWSTTGSPWISSNTELSPPLSNAKPLATTSSFGDFELQFEYSLTAGGSARILARSPYPSTAGAEHAYNINI